MFSKFLTSFMAFMLFMVVSLAPLHAQNVRPPGNAVNLEETAGPPNTLGTESDSDFWRTFRGGFPLDPETILSSPPEGQVMTRSGQLWRVLRENFVGKYLLLFPLGMLVLLALYHLAIGPMKVTAGMSGKTLPRFTLNARVAHWFMALVFFILGFSGLIILLARSVLVPVLGSKVTSVLTSAAMQGHNLFGPLFIVALVWIFIKFVRGNFFQLVDLKWIIKAGGFFGGHVSSSQFNFGEKSWFWMVILIGIVLSATGMALEFPYLFTDLRYLQASTILHAIGALALITVAFGHIYVGTIGMQGSLDSMLKGEVDENWAKEHHDLWYEEMTGKSAKEPAENHAETKGETS